MENVHTPLYLNYLDEFSGYTDAEFGRLIRALLRYARDGVEPEFRRREKLAWPLLRGNADRAAARYEQLRRRRSEAGRLGGAARWAKERESGV